MKNFPNQASDFLRLRATLRTLSDLVELGSDVFDDAVFGYELARRGHYTFRSFENGAHDITGALTDRITQEMTKHPSKQGARTNAREMRRTLSALGWLTETGRVTQEGQALLASAPGSWDERSLLAAGLLDLQITDAAGTSHPVRIMLELLSVAPSLHRDGLELALEARNDSTAELSRVQSLYRLPATIRHGELRATKVQINNAVKIFPTLAKTAGLVVENQAGRLILSPDGAAVIGQAPAEARRRVRAPRVARAIRTRRAVDASTVAPRVGVPHPAIPLTPEQQARADQLLRERTDRHQDLVRATARMISAPGQMYEDPYSFDLLFVAEDRSLPLALFEMKSIEGDAPVQVRLAVGQLSYYHYFEVSPEWPERAVVEIAVFDDGIGRDLAGYLASEGIAAVRINESTVAVLNDVESAMLVGLGLT